MGCRMTRCVSDCRRRRVTGARLCGFDRSPIERKIVRVAGVVARRVRQLGSLQICVPMRLTAVFFNVERGCGNQTGTGDRYCNKFRAEQTGWVWVISDDNSTRVLHKDRNHLREGMGSGEIEEKKTKVQDVNEMKRVSKVDSGT